MATPTYPGGSEFKNTYTPCPEEVQISGTKTLTGRTMTAGEFAFELRDANNVSIGLARNDDQGIFAFPTLSFDEAGTKWARN